MNPTPLALALLCAAGSVLAQEAAAPSPAAPKEPNVKRVLIEDDNARIEELRVRGVTTRISVQPKGAGVAPYEIIPLDAGREMPGTVQSSRGATGQRVWHVLSF